jgi:hypothetical protein
MMTIFQFQKQVSSLPVQSQKDILDRARVQVVNKAVDACEGCRQIPLIAWRGNRKFCNNACKQKAYRQRKENKSCPNK